MNLTPAAIPLPEAVNPLQVLSPKLQAEHQYFPCDVRAAASEHGACVCRRKWCSLLYRHTTVFKSWKLCELGQEYLLWANDIFWGQDLEA